MRMTPLRWVSAALLGIALPALLIAPVPDYRFEEQFRDEFSSRRFSDFSSAANLRVASQRSNTLRNRYFAQRAAELAKEPVIVGAASSPSIVRDARIVLFTRPRADRSAPFDSVVDDVAQKIDAIRARTAAGSRGNVRVVLKTFAQVDAAALQAPIHMPNLKTTQPWAVMPPAIDGRTCLALYPVGSLNQYVQRHSPLIGPCFPYAAFGLPGRGMLQFLADIQYQSGQFVAWDADLQVGRPPVQRPPAFLRELGVLEGVVELRMYSQGGTVNLLPCIAYGGPFCDQIVADEYANFGRSRRSFGNPNVVPFHDWYNNSLSDLGAMYRELGPEQFALIWRSDKPVFATFAEVTGMTVGTFDRKLLLEQTGPYHSGPWPTAATILTLIALCVTATGVATQFGTRPPVA